MVGLRKYRARVHVVPDAAELGAMVAKMPPEQREKVAPSLEQASQPFDVDSILELDPTFDAPIDDAELG